MRRAPPLSEVARVTQRLAVLLAAGVAPGAAWEFVAESTPEGSVPRQVAGSEDVAEALARASATLSPAEGAAWRGLAAAWRCASVAGAPFASTLRDQASSLRSLADTQRDIEVALASPRATMRVVLALPVVGVLFGALLGFGTIPTLFGTPAGWVCLVLGGALVLAARSWSRRLVNRATPRDTTPGLHCDLLAIAVGGGASIERARAAARDACVRFGIEQTTEDRADSAVALAERAGVPVAELLRAEADEARRDARAAAQRSAAALSVQLMAPLGVCVLPAFLVLGVAPLVITILSSTVGGIAG